MGKNDIYMKSYLSDKARVADLFNHTIGQGKELEVHRYRDITMESQSGEILILFVVENQEEIYYAI